MKAEINSNGCLIIKAENDLESYALQQWSNGFECEIHVDSSSSYILDFASYKQKEQER